MTLRQVFKLRGVDETNREEFYTILPELVPEESLRGGWQAEFSVSQFDKNFPDARHAEQEVVPSLEVNSPAPGGKSFVVGENPKKDVRIE